MKLRTTPRTMICCAAFVAMLCSCGRSHKQSPGPSLATTLDEVLNRLAHTGAVCSARVLDLQTGRELYAAKVDEPLMPASNLKLLTSAAALDRFGAGHTFKTYLAIDGEDLWVIGTGDPGTGDPRIAAGSGRTPVSMFDDWADALRKRGISRFRGNLYYYDAALEPMWVHPSWHKDFLVEWFAAPTSGLNFNDNCIDISITPTAAGQPVQFELMPPVRNVQIINKCLTGDTHSPQIVRAIGANTITLTGSASTPARLESKPITDPGAFFADAFRTHLASRGIAVDGRAIRAASPLDGTTPPPLDKVVAVHETRLRDAIFRINKQSQNFFAEAVCKLLGQGFEADQGRSAAGSWEAGRRAIHAFLRQHHIDDSRVVVADGSGLSRDNRATTRVLTDVLAAMYSHPSSNVFRDSLSVAGKDGSLAKRLTDLEGRVLGKPGYIAGVCSVSGYVRTSRGRWLGFAIIYNGGFGADEKPFQLLQDEACRILAEWAE
ncbi:MAG: D-alanyl-D-alanine carboxypeptidase/D-alanyl-D-alanine-endopeptidase [Planctomycetota bacterium]|nr:D-alanyl-D-alanine carboxypeptidase/D-alanyl-D-alanine-endopeptidase [Planctomycetota bacterium]